MSAENGGLPVKLSELNYEDSEDFEAAKNDLEAQGKNLTEDEKDQLKLDNYERINDPEIARNLAELENSIRSTVESLQNRYKKELERYQRSNNREQFLRSMDGLRSVIGAKVTEAQSHRKEIADLSRVDADSQYLAFMHLDFKLMKELQELDREIESIMVSLGGSIEQQKAEPSPSSPNEATPREKTGNKADQGQEDKEKQENDIESADWLKKEHNVFIKRDNEQGEIKAIINDIAVGQQLRLIEATDLPYYMLHRPDVKTGSTDSSDEELYVVKIDNVGTIKTVAFDKDSQTVTVTVEKDGSEVHYTLSDGGNLDGNSLESGDRLANEIAEKIRQEEKEQQKRLSNAEEIQETPRSKAIEQEIANLDELCGAIEFKITTVNDKLDKNTLKKNLIDLKNGKYKFRFMSYDINTGKEQGKEYSGGDYMSVLEKEISRIGQLLIEIENSANKNRLNSREALKREELQKSLDRAIYVYQSHKAVDLFDQAQERLAGTRYEKTVEEKEYFEMNSEDRNGYIKVERHIDFSEYKKKSSEEQGKYKLDPKSGLYVKTEFVKTVFLKESVGAEELKTLNYVEQAKFLRQPQKDDEGNITSFLNPDVEQLKSLGFEKKEDEKEKNISVLEELESVQEAISEKNKELEELREGKRTRKNKEKAAKLRGEIRSAMERKTLLEQIIAEEEKQALALNALSLVFRNRFSGVVSNEAKAKSELGIMYDDINSNEFYAHFLQRNADDFRKTLNNVGGGEASSTIETELGRILKTNDELIKHGGLRVSGFGGKIADAEFAAGMKDPLYYGVAGHEADAARWTVLREMLDSQHALLRLKYLAKKSASGDEGSPSAGVDQDEAGTSAADKLREQIKAKEEDLKNKDEQLREIYKHITGRYQGDEEQMRKEILTVNEQWAKDVSKIKAERDKLMEELQLSETDVSLPDTKEQETSTDIDEMDAIYNAQRKMIQTYQIMLDMTLAGLHNSRSLTISTGTLISEVYNGRSLDSNTFGGIRDDNVRAVHDRFTALAGSGEFDSRTQSFSENNSDFQKIIALAVHELRDKQSEFWAGKPETSQGGGLTRLVDHVFDLYCATDGFDTINRESKEVKELYKYYVLVKMTRDDLLRKYAIEAHGMWVTALKNKQWSKLTSTGTVAAAIYGLVRGKDISVAHMNLEPILKLMKKEIDKYYPIEEDWVDDQGNPIKNDQQLLSYLDNVNDRAAITRSKIEIDSQGMDKKQIEELIKERQRQLKEMQSRYDYLTNIRIIEKTLEKSSFQSEYGRPRGTLEEREKGLMPNTFVRKELEKVDGGNKKHRIQSSEEEFLEWVELVFGYTAGDQRAKEMLAYARNDGLISENQSDNNESQENPEKMEWFDYIQSDGWADYRFKPENFFAGDPNWDSIYNEQKTTQIKDEDGNVTGLRVAAPITDLQDALWATGDIKEMCNQKVDPKWVDPNDDGRALRKVLGTLATTFSRFTSVGMDSRFESAKKECTAAASLFIQNILEAVGGDRPVRKIDRYGKKTIAAELYDATYDRVYGIIEDTLGEPGTNQRFKEIYGGDIRMFMRLNKEYYRAAEQAWDEDNLYRDARRELFSKLFAHGLLDCFNNRGECVIGGEKIAQLNKNGIAELSPGKSVPLTYMEMFLAQG